MAVGGCGWLWAAVDGCGWLWAAVDGPSCALSCAPSRAPTCFPFAWRAYAFPAPEVGCWSTAVPPAVPPAVQPMVCQPAMSVVRPSCAPSCLQLCLQLCTQLCPSCALACTAYGWGHGTCATGLPSQENKLPWRDRHPLGERFHIPTAVPSAVPPRASACAAYGLPACEVGSPPLRVPSLWIASLPERLSAELMVCVLSIRLLVVFPAVLSVVL
jgi:hypothetical protein